MYIAMDTSFEPITSVYNLTLNDYEGMKYY